MSARHQVKRPDRPFQEFAPSKTGPAEETSFLRSVRISRAPQFHRRSSAQVKSGPDVFADALVPQAAQNVPGTFDFPKIPTSIPSFGPRRAAAAMACPESAAHRFAFVPRP